MANSLAAFKRGWRRLSGLALAVGVTASVLAVSTLSASPARAMIGEGPGEVMPMVATAGPGYEVPAVEPTGAGAIHWAGPFEGPNGKVSWCVEAGKIASRPSEYSGTIENFQLAAALTLYEKVNTAESNAALAYLVHWVADKSQYTAAWQNDVARAHPSVVSLAERYWNEAARYNGKYSIKANSFTSTDGGATYNLNGVRVFSGSHDIPGTKITLRIPSDAPATFEGGQKSIEITTGGSAKIIAQGAGSLRVEYEAKGLPSNGLLRTYRERPDMQLMLVSPDPMKVTGRSEAVQLGGKFFPKVASQVQSEFMSEGEKPVDAITVTLGDRDPWATENGQPVAVKVRGTLYGPFAQPQTASKKVPAGAPVVAEKFFTVTGPTTKNMGDDVVLDKSGYYTWVWEIRKADQTDSVRSRLKIDYSDGFFTPGEIPIVRMKPQIVTEVAARKVKTGDKMVDRVTLSITDGATWITDKAGQPVAISATGTLYGPFPAPLAETDAVPVDAPVVGTEDLSFTEAGTKETAGALVAPAGGFYTWVWEIPGSDYYDAYKSNFMIPTETAVSQWEVKHHSEVREYTVGPGGRAFDTIEISGMPDDHGDFAGGNGWSADAREAKVTVYGPMKDEPSTAEVPADAPVFKEFTIPSTNGKFRIGYDDATKVEVPQHDGEGYYVFVYSFAGDDRVPAFTSPFNDVLERFRVPAPASGEKVRVITQATREAVTGQPIRDTALVTGSDKDLKDTYLIFRAYLDESEDGVAQCEAPFFTSEKVAVGTSGLYESGDTSVSKPGKVYWIETLYESGGKVIAEGKCGIPSETTTVTQPPNVAVTTQATEAVTLGAPARDTAIVTGTMPEGGLTLSFEAFEAAKDQTGAPVCLPENRVFSTEYGKIDEVGSYKSAEVVFKKAGDYYWVETLVNDKGEIVHRGKCGLPNETTKVTEVKVTTKATSSITLGAPARDTAIVTGTVPAGATLSFEAFKATKKDGKFVCEAGNRVFSTVYGAIEKPGEYTSAEVTFKEVGDYHWVETLTDSKGSIIHRGECGIANETTTVKPKPSALAKTGADIAGYLLAGSALIGLGAGTLFVIRRKRA